MQPDENVLWPTMSPLYLYILLLHINVNTALWHSSGWGQDWLSASHVTKVSFFVSCTLQLFFTDAFLWCLSSESWHAYWQPHTRTHAADIHASFTQRHCVSNNIFQEVGWQTHISKQHILCSKEAIVCTKVSLHSQLQLCRCRPTWPETLSLKPTKTHSTLPACPFCGLMTYFCLY